MSGTQAAGVSCIHCLQDIQCFCPTAFPDEVIEVMAREPKICKYLDIPFQHISDDQLAAMHRRHTKAQAYELIDKLRQAIPDLALRTTLLVGYPG